MTQPEQDEIAVNGAMEKLEGAVDLIDRLRLAIRQSKLITDAELWAISLAIHRAYDSFDDARKEWAAERDRLISEREIAIHGNVITATRELNDQVLQLTKERDELKAEVESIDKEKLTFSPLRKELERLTTERRELVEGLRLIAKDCVHITYSVNGPIIKEPTYPAKVAQELLAKTEKGEPQLKS